MNAIARIGVDLSKNVMQIHAVDHMGRVVVRKAVTRASFLNRFVNVPPCLVAMEACSGAGFVTFGAAVS
ncbi:hypothetical protein [Paraburkholderia sp. MM5482-R1]|uniref:hypothetical protein n=1 Tax=unclassified Paraburkholderia TaxID=2615204 RepID=UPI003D25C12C